MYVCVFEKTRKEIDKEDTERQDILEKLSLSEN